MDVIVSAPTQVSAIQCKGSGRCCVHELPDWTHNAAPDRHTSGIPDLPEFVSPSRAFYLGKVAVALDHQLATRQMSMSGIMPKKVLVRPLLAVKAPAKADPRSLPPLTVFGERPVQKARRG